MRWALLALLVVFLGVVGVIYAKTTDRERIDAKTVAGRNFLLTSTSSIYQKYQDNVVGADNEFLNRVVELEVLVTFIGKTNNGTPYLGLAVNDVPTADMTATFNDELRNDELRALGEVRVGQTVRLDCICKGHNSMKYPNALMLQSCHLVR
jgi:hypothetical protein